MGFRAVFARDKMAMPKFELTVKTGRHLTHTHDLEQGVSFLLSPSHLAYGVIWGKGARSQLTRAKTIM